jgi:methionyl-tRNA formyltransferase
VAQLEGGRAQAQAQDEALATYAPMLKKADGFLDPTWPTRKLADHFRAFKARPGTQLQLHGGELLKVHELSIAGAASAEPGLVLAIDEARGFQVATADGSIWLGQVQPPSAKAMAAADYARGRHLKAGFKFERPVLAPDA